MLRREALAFMRKGMVLQPEALALAPEATILRSEAFKHTMEAAVLRFGATMLQRQAMALQHKLLLLRTMPWDKPNNFPCFYSEDFRDLKYQASPRKRIV
jgi:hypothetical protein